MVFLSKLTEKNPTDILNLHMNMHTICDKCEVLNL